MCYNGDNMDITIREVDEELYRQAKARAALMGATVGCVVNMALERWLGEDSEKKSRRSIAELLEPIPFGKGSEHLSERIDDILYGGKE